MAKRLCIVLLIIACFLVSCSKKNTKTLSVEKIDIVIGTMGVNALDEIEAYKPFVYYLNNQESLQAYHFKTLAFSNLEQMKNSLKNEETDIYIDSPFPVITIMDETGLEIAFNRMKGGVKEYHSVIFVHKDSNIYSITDLLGRTIAFEDPSSTSSYFLPKTALINEGLQCEEFSEVSSGASESVRYIFSNDDSNTALWVYIQKVQAGATNDIAYEQFPPKYRQDFRIIYRTQKVPRHLLSWRSDLDSELKSLLEYELLNMHKSSKGKESLKKFENTKAFEKISNINDIVTLFKPLNSDL